MLAAKKGPAAGDVGPLLGAIWNTNQFRNQQKELYEGIRSGHEPAISFASFSATAKNLISFAVVMVLIAIGWLIWLLGLQISALA